MSLNLSEVFKNFQKIQDNINDLKNETGLIYVEFLFQEKSDDFLILRDLQYSSPSNITQNPTLCHILFLERLQ